MNIYAFDVDDTLDVSGGPISVVSLGGLKSQGHIVGLNGNWAAVSSIGPALAFHFQLHRPDGNVEGHFSESAQKLYLGGRLHHGRKHQRGKRGV